MTVKSSLLEMLEKNKGEVLSGEKMARLICETLPEEIKKYQMSPVTHV